MHNEAKLFMQFEESNSMFDKTFKGVHYWQLIRVELFEYIMNYRLNLGIRHPDLENNKNASIKNAFKLCRNAFVNKGKWKNAEGRILVSGTCKKRNDLIELFIKEFDKSIFFLDRPRNYEHILKSDLEKTYYSDWLDLKRGIAITLFSHLGFYKKKAKKEISIWIEEIEKQFNCKLDINKFSYMLIYDVITIKILVPYFTKVLKNNRPKLIVVTPFYEKFNSALVSAGHSLKIPVYELQHGFISKNHIAYNYKTIHNEYLPDIFLFFGEYWRDSITFPEKNRMLICGSLELEQTLQKYKGGKSRNSEGDIIIISQGPYSKVLYAFAVELADALECSGIKLNIIYKLHPSEVQTWNQMHPTYNDPRIRFDSGNIYDLFSKSSIQVGIDSTALFEGIAFGLNTFIIDCDYLKNSDMKTLCNDGYVQLVQKADDLIKNINANSIFKRVDYIWEKNAENNIKKQILKFIK